MIYYTADLHFHYAPILTDAARPFSGIAEMDEALVRNWNQTVGPEDTVYVVGDLGYNGGFVPCDILERLRGRLHLIRGNHDTPFADAPLLYRYFETVTDFNEIDDGGTHVLLCHYPILYTKRGYMVHGHLHNARNEIFETLKRFPHVLNCGVDVNFYRPVTLQELIAHNRRYYNNVLLFPAPEPMPRGTEGWLPPRADFRPLPDREPSP
ncbi:MAG: metallophosphoesterase [Oscillospiraceae bacterium]|nr:metallophosphoesterase [Oscillospiraceae bacterium]